MLTAGPHIQFIEKHTRKTIRPQFVRLVKAYRTATRHFRVLPDFIIIGARKCGTTSLYEYLTQHPCVLPALSKELYYFDYHYELGEPWYKRHFPTLWEKQIYQKSLGQQVITGEATPSYFYQPVVAQRIAKMRPDTKIILLLREPIAAAYSAYQFGIKKCTYTASEVNFDQLVKSELAYIRQAGSPFHCQNNMLSINPQCSLLGRHTYVELLKPWLDVFGFERIKIILSEELFSNTPKVYEDTQRFLDLPLHQLASYQPHNENTYTALRGDNQKLLQEYFAPYNEQLSRLLGRQLEWNYPLSETSDPDACRKISSLQTV